MTPRGDRLRLVGLSLLAAVLAALYFAGDLFGPAGRTQRQASDALLSGFKPAAVARLELRSPDGEVVQLQKGESGWTVSVAGERLPASAARVQSLLSSLGELRSGKIMGADPTRLPDFGLSPASAGRIEARGADGSVIAAIEVGKHGPSGNEDYLLKIGQREVHLTRSSLSFYLGRDLQYWYDLAVLPYDVTGPGISEISVEGTVPADANAGSSTREDYRLVREIDTRGEWTVSAGGVRLDQTRVDSLANALATIQGVDFFGGSQPPPAGDAAFRVGVITKAGARYAFHAWPVLTVTGRRVYLVRRESNSLVYVVNPDAIGRAVMPLRDLESPQQVNLR